MEQPRLPSGYREHDAARWVDEPPKRPGRSPFARDRARLVHSAALRRLAAKTQVVGPGTSDAVRNRLTHTLEVAQVGRELAVSVGCDPDVVETACLAHDIGHPPFGHNGERALDEMAADIGGFEGNAQTLRILTRLEPKTMLADGRSAGLNLTRACVDAAVKYPWSLADAPGPLGAQPAGTRRQARKFGVYAEDADAFGWVRAGAPERDTCVEAQVMDLADDIAYSVHDMEDGVVSGRIDLTRLLDDDQAKQVFAAVYDWYLPDASADDLWSALQRLQDLADWPDSSYDGTRASLAALKNLTSALIGCFCRSVERATHAVYGGGPLVRYQARLRVPDRTRHEIALLKGVAAHYVMRGDDRVTLLREQRQVTRDLVTALARGAPRGLEPSFRHDFARARDDTTRLRVVVDQVASLTDASALVWHAELCR